MKKCIFLFVATFLGVSSQAQTFEIYQVKLNAKEIPGLIEFNPKKQDGSTFKEILTHNWIPKKIDEYTEMIGGYTDDAQSYTPRALFNMSTLKEEFAFLDKIDMKYYQAKGFDKLKRTNPEVNGEPLFDEFYKRFTSARTAGEKKTVILDNAYDKYRWMLVDSRLSFSPKSTFSLTKKQQTSYTMNLKSELKSVVKDIDASIAQKVDGYINGLVDKAISLTGSFFTVSFDDAYVTFLSTYIGSVKSEDLERDLFIANLDKYISSPHARLITKIGVMTIAANYDRSRVSDKNILTELTSKFDIPSAQATEIAVALSAGFQTKKTINFNSNFSGAIIMGIVTDKSLDGLAYGHLEKAMKIIMASDPLPVDTRLADVIETVFDGEHKVQMEIKRTSDKERVTFHVEIPAHITWGKKLCFYKNGSEIPFDCTIEVRDDIKMGEKSFTRDQLNDKTFVEMKKVGFVGTWNTLSKKEFKTEQILGTSITFRWLKD